MKLGDKVKHKKDGYTGRVIKVDNIFVHLDNGRHILKQYAENGSSTLVGTIFSFPFSSWAASGLRSFGFGR